MNYAQMRAFHRVATEGTFSKAAAALHVSQPTISAHVKALEAVHGVRLFDRRRRLVEPTEFGARLLTLTRRLFDLEEEIDELMSAGRALDRGHLKIGTDSPAHSSPLMAAVTRRYPGLSLSLATGNADEMRSAVLEYRTDVAVVAKASDDARVDVLELQRDPLVFFAHRAHPFLSGRGHGLAAVIDHRLVLREPESITRQLFEAALQAGGLTAGHIMEIDSREGVHEAVAAGLGVGVVARSEVAHDPRLRSVRIPGAGLIMTEYVLCLRERRRLPVVGAFMEIAAELAAGRAPAGAL